MGEKELRNKYARCLARINEKIKTSEKWGQPYIIPPNQEPYDLKQLLKDFVEQSEAYRISFESAHKAREENRCPEAEKEYNQIYDDYNAWLDQESSLLSELKLDRDACIVFQS